jgi:hypothetical protein
MKRRFIPPFIIVYQMETEVPMESVSIEDAAKVLYAKDKLVTDLDMISEAVSHRRNTVLRNWVKDIRMLENSILFCFI